MIPKKAGENDDAGTIDDRDILAEAMISSYARTLDRAIEVLLSHATAVEELMPKHNTDAFVNFIADTKFCFRDWTTPAGFEILRRLRILSESASHNIRLLRYPYYSELTDEKSRSFLMQLDFNPFKALETGHALNMIQGSVSLTAAEERRARQAEEPRRNEAVAKERRARQAEEQRRNEAAAEEKARPASCNRSHLKGVCWGGCYGHYSCNALVCLHHGCIVYRVSACLVWSGLLWCSR